MTIQKQDRKAFVYWFIFVWTIWLLFGDLGVLNLILLLLIKNVVFAWITPSSSVLLPLEKPSGLISDSLRRTGADFTKRSLENWFGAAALLTIFSGITVSFLIIDQLLQVVVSLVLSVLAFFCMYNWLVKSRVKNSTKAN